MEFILAKMDAAVLIQDTSHHCLLLQSSSPIHSSLLTYITIKQQVLVLCVCVCACACAHAREESLDLSWDQGLFTAGAHQICIPENTSKHQ
jgi:hypothetical protein